MNVTSKNFADLALRTAAGGTLYPEKVTISHFRSALSGLIANAEELDKAKKALFYGKSSGFVKTDASNVTLLKLADGNVDVLHSIIGIATEAGELAENITSLMPGVYSPVNVLEEYGDILWYLAIGIEALPENIVKCLPGESKLEAVMRRNIQKLQTRYPEKFTESAALHRDTVSEIENMQRD